MAMRKWLAAPLCALFLLAGPAQAQPAADRPVERGRDELANDPTFGPVLVIESIEIRGNTATAERLIRRAIPIEPGDALRAGDPRLRQARYKVLAMGFFRSVDVSLRKGTARGQVILEVAVVERGTVVLDSMLFGTSGATPGWAGLELTERNLLGTGMILGGGLVWAAGGDVEGATEQWAGRIHAGDPSILGTPFGAHGSVLHASASEPYRVRGDPSDSSTDNFRALNYTRTGVSAGMSVEITPLSRLSVDGRFEHVDAQVPAAPTRDHPDGSVSHIELGLLPDDSRVVTVGLGFDRDTRPDPVLPYAGDRLVVLGELGATWMGGSYTYGTALARYQHWWPVRGEQHVVSIHLTGGVVLGDAPRFDQLHVSDFNRLLTPRVLGGLVVSTTASHDLLGTDSADVSYGEIGGSGVVEYSFRLFRRQRHVYGGDLFVGAGLWALADSQELLVRYTSVWRALPVDLFIDAGLRLDTEIGIFELTFANALGRVPL
jgi:outer membrane protein insertion porin family